MNHWHPNTKLILNDIPENFNVDDFCELIKKEVFKTISIGFTWNTSTAYQNNFKAAIENLEKIGNLKQLFLNLLFDN